MPDKTDSNDQQRTSLEQSSSQTPRGSIYQTIEANTETIKTTDGKQPSGQDESSASKEFRRFEKVQLWINGGLLVVGAAVCVIYGCQLGVMNKQLNEMRSSGQQSTTQANNLIDQATAQANAAKAQSEQAVQQTTKMGESLGRTDNLIRATNDMAREIKRSADLARQSLDQSKGAYRLDQRPWMVITNYRLSEEPQPGKSFTVVAYMANVGKTPAFKLTPQSQVYIWAGEPPFLAPPSVPKTFSRGMIAPNGPPRIFNTDPWTLTPAQTSAYNEGKTNIYVRAMIRYTDIFKVDHWTSACVAHLHGTPLDEWVYCENGNEADY